MKRIIPAIFSVSFIIASLVLSVNGVGYKAIPDAYANTNALHLPLYHLTILKLVVLPPALKVYKLKKSLTLIMSLDI